MKQTLLITQFFTLICFVSFSQDFTSNLETPAPMKIANNAVTGAMVNGVPHVYSFAGIDSTKRYNGINLKSFRYNTQTQLWDTIPDLPDTRGKIAAGASNIDSVIYIIGGYYVDRFGGEVSSNKIHRYNIYTNSYLTDGSPLPVATVDHVQAVWKDSLIYVITGWNNVANIPNVQIYDPKTDTWTSGTPVPNNNTYKSFGASGTIVGNTIYYYGGASSGTGFPIQNVLRVGEINPSNPSQITWSDTVIDPAIATYRAACVGNTRGINWLGGSEVTYNYNGIAYNGSGGVSATSKNIYYNPQDSTLSYKFIYGDSLPMDLRGVADFGTTKYLVGGMIRNQQVTNKVWKLDFVAVGITELSKLEKVEVYPNPTTGIVKLKGLPDEIYEATIFSVNGEKLYFEKVSLDGFIMFSSYSPGIYFIQIRTKRENITRKIILE